MISPLAVIDRYYPHFDELRRLLLHHSWQVADRALRCAAAHRELPIDRHLLLRGALLHDLGVFQTRAPSIHCYGTEHYLMHGFIGARLLRELGCEAEARICERHTGTGLTAQTILERGLSVEPRDYLPETLEEQLVCYADKFYSKSRPDQVLTFEQVCTGLQRYGERGVEKFREWHAMFG